MKAIIALIRWMGSAESTALAIAYPVPRLSGGIESAVIA